MSIARFAEDDEDVVAEAVEETGAEVEETGAEEVRVEGELVVVVCAVRCELKWLRKKA